MKYFVNKYVALINPATISTRPAALRYLPERTVIDVDTALAVVIKTANGDRTCVLATYSDGVKPAVTGYVHFECIEKWVDTFPYGNVGIQDQTANTKDAWQYMTYAGKVQYNFCGQFSLQKALNLPSIMNVLDVWKAKDRKWYETFFNTKYTARGTSDGELQRLAKILGYDAVLLSLAMRNHEGKDVRYTPAALAGHLERGPIIASVNVDPAFYFVNGSGTLHWVVVTEVIQDGVYGGGVFFWNSLTDKIEWCSWREWVKTTRNSPYGIFIENAV